MNRLTRELTSLRQQTASVASNASSTSTGLLEASEHGSAYGGAVTSRPTPHRHHRSSSSLSSRGGLASAPSGVTDQPPSSGIAPPRDTMGPPSISSHRHVLSRYESAASSMISNAGSYSIASNSTHLGDHAANMQQRSAFSPVQAPASPISIRSSIIGAGARLDEVAQYRADLESARTENEVLRHRIRELEGLRVHHQSNTTPTGPDAATAGESGDPEDDIQVGESALSKGINKGG